MVVKTHDLSRLKNFNLNIHAIESSLSFISSLELY